LPKVRNISIRDITPSSMPIYYTNANAIKDLVIPPVDFYSKHMDRGTAQNLNKWKNQFEYAEKVKEPGRMIKTVTEISDVAEIEANGDLYCLAGLLAHYSGLPEARSRQLFETAATYGSRTACIARAAIAVKAGIFTEASEWLLRAIEKAKSEQPTGDEFTLLKMLGKYVSMIPNRAVPGLSTICAMSLGEEYDSLANEILASSLAKISPKAAQSILSGNIDAARLFAPDAISFRSIRSIERIKPVSVTSVPPTSKRNGKITAFKVESDYGFLVEAKTSVTWWFHLSHVIDQILVKSLGRYEVDQLVEFEGDPAVDFGKNYPKVDRMKMSPDFIDSLKSVAPSGLSISDRLKYLPKNHTTYANAKREYLTGNIQQAEALYRLAIEEDDSQSESAVKDLAAMLNENNRSVEAIDLIKKYRSRFGRAKQASFNRLSITIYQKMRDYQSVISTLETLLKAELRPSQKTNLERQIAAVEFQRGSPEVAFNRLNSIIKRNPTDFQTIQLLDTLKRKQEAGTEAGLSLDVDESERAVLSLVYGVSELASGLLDSCQMRGVDERSKESNQYSEKDFKAVRTLLERIRGRRPQERADYFLTLARLCEEADEGAAEDNRRSYLRRYFLHSGEAAMSGNLPIDTQRCYLTESLSLFGGDKSDGDRGNAWVLLLGTYVSQAVDPSDLLGDERYEDRLKRVLGRFFPQDEGWKKFQGDFPYYRTMAAEASAWLMEILPKLSLALSLSGVPHSSALEIDRIQECNRNAKICFSGALTSEAMKRGRDDLYGIQGKARFVLDVERIRQTSRLFGDGSDYCAELNFRNLETKYLRLEADISRLIDEIKRAPTKLTYEHLTPPLEKLREALKTDFSKRCATPPIFGIQNVLDNDYYTQDHSGSVSLRFELKSTDSGSPPVEGIDVLIAGCAADPCHSPTPLYGGESRELAVSVRPTPEQINGKAFSVNVSLRYRNRSGLLETSPQFPVAIRLGDRAQFSEICNPYSRYAGGSPVDDEKMFYGRRDLINRIIKHTTEGSLGQCFVLYGQKRSGKSSVLKQVHQSLPAKTCLGIRMSIGDLDLSKIWPSFSRTLIRELVYSLEDRTLPIPDEWPALDDAEANPLEAIRFALRQIKKMKLRPVITVDEFTYIYEQAPSIAQQFMRGWKGLLEQQLFSSVLVGQDTMPRFKQAFANEFGVTHDERISYLTKDEALQLASEPILFSGESRFRGRALESLFGLTAGSPFFEQIFCDSLVRYLNVRRASFVTEADVAAVGRDLVSGINQLPQDRFDSLISAAAEAAEKGKLAGRWRVLSTFTRSASSSGWVAKSSLPSDEETQEVLKDLRERDVIAFENEAYRIRVGLFFDWIRANYLS
jgi:hypothetical protein